jgi:hypothetical protein
MTAIPATPGGVVKTWTRYGRPAFDRDSGVRVETLGVPSGKP